MPNNLPKSSQDLEGLKAFFTNLRTQFASAAGVYEGPIQAMFTEVTGKLETVLAGLPKTADSGWCLTEKLDWLFDSLSSTSSLINGLTLELAKLKAEKDAMAATLAALPPVGAPPPEDPAAAATKLQLAIDAAIAARTAEAGDLVPKSTVEQLCSAAKALGISEGRTAVELEHAAEVAAAQLQATRATALTTAGLPLPDASVASVLRASEELFTAARATAETRLQALTAAGLELSPALLANVWAPASHYDVFQSLVTGIAALKRAPRPPASEPFASGPAGSGATPAKHMLG